MAVPSFTESVATNGYRWWYLDATSDDNRHALTVIVFIGSVFSPYYARARQKGPADAHQFCSVNVALYGSPSRWCMTERTSSSVLASDESLSIGRSRIQLDKNRMIVDIDEIAVPLPARVKGRLVVELPAYDLSPHALDSVNNAQPVRPGNQGDEARHFWKPIAPQTRIRVSMQAPALQWQGSAYVDSNYGDAPLESAFRSWVWSRCHEAHNCTTILYDVEHRNGQQSQRSLHYAADGSLTQADAPSRHNLKPTRYWRIQRPARTSAATTITDLQTLEDTPFYSRSRFFERSDTGARTTVHESLYLDRFDTFWVRSLLPFRMPRRKRPVLPL